MDTDIEVSMDTPNSSLMEQDTSLNKNISSILSMLDSPAAATEEEHEIQDTQCLKFLKDVVAYVEVRTGTENRSKAICRELLQMGATVVPKFNNEVTHVIFKDGKKSTCDKATKKGVYLVSVLWVDSCKQNQDRVCETMFPGNKPQAKGTPIMVARLKKAKSMQPKDFDEEVASSAERNVKNRKRMATKAKYRVITTPGDGDGVTPTHRPMFVVENTCPRSPNESLSLCHSITIPATPPSMREKMNHLRTRKSLGISDVVSCSESDTDESIKKTPHIPGGDPMPLQRRLFGNDEEAPTSAHSSPLFLSGGSSNNSTTATSPYIEKLLKQKQRKKSYTESPLHGSPCNQESSFPPEYDVKSNKNVRSSIKHREEDPHKWNKKLKSQNSESSDSENDDNSNGSSNDTADEQDCEYNLTGQNKNKVVRVKSFGKKKKLLNTMYDKPSSQLIAPLRQSDDEKSENEGPKKINNRNKRRKVTAKKKNNTGTSRDPTVLFTGKEITHKVNQTFKPKMKRKKSLYANEEEEIHGTPKKKVKMGLNNEEYIENTEQDTVQSDDNHCEVNLKSNISLKAKRESNFKGQKKSILKGKNIRFSDEAEESQPIALNIDTPSGSGTKSGNSKITEKNNKSVSGSVSKEITSRRKSVNFNPKLNENTIDHEPDKHNSLRGRRKSIASSHVSNEVESETSIHKKRFSRRSSVLSKRSITPKPEEPVVLDSEEISPEIAFQSSKSKVDLLKPASRRRSVRLSNLNNSTLSTQITQEADDDDSLTDVTALSTQNVTLTPSGRTKKLLPILAKSKQNNYKAKFKHLEKEHMNKHLVNDTLNESVENNKFANGSHDKSIENLRGDAFNPYDEALISKCESMLNDKDVSGEYSKISTLNLTNCRKSIDEFSMAPVLKKKLKGRSTSLPLSNPKQSSGKSNKVKASEIKKSVIKNNVHIHKLDKQLCKSEHMSTSLWDKRKWKKVEILSDVGQEPTKNLVMTSLHFDEQDMVHSVVQRLGGFSIQDTVNKQTTHVVCGEGQRRTLNVLYCIAQGGWLLSLEWVFKSLEAGHWLDEEEYEMSECFPSCKISREEKDLNNSRCGSNLFSSEGALYVVDASKPPKKDLVKLLKLCGGKISSSPRQADVCIGSTTKAEKLCLSEQWVLDSITQMKILPYESYILNSFTRFEREPSPDY